MAKSANKKPAVVMDDKKAIGVRLNRIIGQLNGVKRMFEEGKSCEDLIVQLSAVDKSIKSVANLMVENHLKTDFVAELQKDDAQAVKRITYFVKMFQ